MLTDALVEQILTRLPNLTIGVLGDLFLDRYLDIDASLTEKSIETGLDAYQVTQVRSLPGALGTIINNLVALGVGRVLPVSIIGNDGEGFELRQALAKMKPVDTRWIFSAADRRTPTYTKPMLHEGSQPARELNRLDIKNRTPTPGRLEDMAIEALQAVWPQINALIVLDQVSEENCGVVTKNVREQLAHLGEEQPDKFVLVDSRERIDLFRSVSLKPNNRECRRALDKLGILPDDLFPGLLLGDDDKVVRRFAQQFKRPVYYTMGKFGILLANQDSEGIKTCRCPAYHVNGPIDEVGAGDSTSAGITCAVAAGASHEQAAAFGCLVASITIQQIGTTGTASPEQVRRRWAEVRETTSSAP
jgi:bifunctional ADP-heptose synthase (sugar kinase/adenylyltransferase)